MVKDKRAAANGVELRSRAEDLLHGNTTQGNLSLTEADAQKLLHEVDVQRIELQMQNAELRRARDDAETALASYTELYDFAPIGYFTLDSTGVIRNANLTGAALLGTERSRLIGRRFTLVIADAARSPFTVFLEKVCASGGKETCEVMLTGKKEQPLFLRIEGMAGKSGEECRIAAIDISEIKHAENELRLRDRTLMQQSRQAALGEMISTIAHHWRQPLNAVGLIIQELAYASENSRLTTDHLKESVDKAMRIILSLSQTLNDFRNFFTPDREMSRFEVNRVIAGTVSFVEESFKQERIAIDVKSSDNPFIEGYQQEYSQVLLNILFNARDVLLEKLNGGARIKVCSFSEEGKAVVTITDNGGGIKTGILERIFEPYFTTKDGCKRTGVGLFMAKSVIENHMGGSLTVRNVDEGAEFRIEV